MKFAATVLSALLLTEQASAFVPGAPIHHTHTGSSARFMADMPAAVPAETTSDLPVLQQNAYGQPSDVRYSDFLKLVNADRIEKVTFSADGTQLLGVDVDGVRVKIEALPNDPDLLSSLTNHKVRIQNQNRWRIYYLKRTESSPFTLSVAS